MDNRGIIEPSSSPYSEVAVKLRRTLFALRNEVNQKIEDMENRGIIELSSSPYSAPILLVPRANGSSRFCAGLRALKNVSQYSGHFSGQEI